MWFLLVRFVVGAAMVTYPVDGICYTALSVMLILRVIRVLSFRDMVAGNRHERDLVVVGRHLAVDLRYFAHTRRLARVHSSLSQFCWPCFARPRSTLV